MRENPLISIVTAAYNGARFLPYLIESVKAQSYRKFEHIIIDDGSTDGGETVRVLQSYPHVRWWSQENKGQYATQNDGLRAARGDIIAIINQDDAYASPSVFAEVVEYWRLHPRCGFVYGRSLYIDENNTVLPYRRGIEGRRSKWLIKHVSFIPHISMFFDRRLVVDNEIFFDPEFRMSGDWEWLIRVLEVTEEYGFVDSPVALFRIHRDQKTLSIGKSGFNPENKIVCRRHGINPLVNAVLRRYSNFMIRAKTSVEIIRREGFTSFVARLLRFTKRNLFGGK